MGDPKFKGIEYKVGIFIIIAVLIVISTVIMLAVQNDLLTKKINVIIYSDSGEGLKKGMPIIYSGFQISRVDSIFLEDSGRVKINAGIPLKYTKWIKIDSKVKLVAQNFIGSQSLVFSGGSISKEPVSKEHEFDLFRDRGIDELIEKAKPVMDDVKVIVSNIRILSDRFVDEQGDFGKLMQVIGEISSEISAKENSLGIILRTDYLTNNIDTMLSGINITRSKVDSLIDQVDKIMKIAETRINETEATIPLLNENLTLSKKLMGDIDLKLQELNPILNDVKQITSNVASSTSDLKLLRDDVELMMDTGLEMILELNQMWPFATKDKGGPTLKLP